VWKKGWKYVDSAQFRTFDQLKTFAKQYLGAHNVTDNAKLIRSIDRLTTPEAWKQKVQPGDLLMFSYNKPDRRDPTKPGRPTTVGHTAPVLEVKAGATLRSTRLSTMNGDIQLSTGEALAATVKDRRITDIHAVSGGKSLSNYPDLNGKLFKVLQKYNWNKPIGPTDMPQAQQGPLRWGLFK